jgi:hypothetical protein
LSGGTLVETAAMRRRRLGAATVGGAAAAIGLAVLAVAGCTSAPAAVNADGTPTASAQGSVPQSGSSLATVAPSTPTATATATAATTTATATATVTVDSVQQIRDAFAAARPGEVIQVADGEYEFEPRLEASASGSATAPITVRGSRNVVFRSKDTSDDYGLFITGDFWRVEGLTVAHASKGIVLEGSVGTMIDGVEVFDIGDEAVHFRACSSDGVLRNSFLHDTGRDGAQYGEGVYVGSASSNWSKYQCADVVEGDSLGDNTERVLIEDNVFENVPAEGADMKEGTDSGTLRRNAFRRTGTSGRNSADSAVDIQGNNWVIEDNVVSESDATWDDNGVARPSEFADGFQTHAVEQGYGTGNIFRRNSVVGPIAGFAVGLYPAAQNVVSCDNAAPGAALGLVGASGKPAACQP